MDDKIGVAQEVDVRGVTAFGLLVMPFAGARAVRLVV
jgi:hypothetical protein